MIRLPPRLACLLVLGLLVSTHVSAQVIADPKLRNAPENGHPAPSANLSPLARAAWPRLDPGAILCRSRADLDAHRRAVAARLDGEAAPLVTEDCRIISAPTAIDVVTRAGPGNTEVRIKGEQASGWTDTWLPSQPPR